MPKRRKQSADYKEKVITGRKTFVRYEEGAELYSVGLHTFQKWAKDAGAVYKIKGIVLVNVAMVDEFLEAFKE